MRWYKLALWKTYFDNGYGITSPLKWDIGIYGASTLDTNTLLFFVIYLFSCFFFGWIVLKSGFFEALQEVVNKHNLLAKELRNSKILKGKN